MKRTLLFLLVAAGSVALAVSAWAATPTDTETQLDNDAAALDATAADGGAAMLQAIETTFNVSAAQVAALQADKLGFGEIVVVLSLAQSLPGGIDTATIDQVLALRQGPPVQGWGVIARGLGLNLGTVVSSVEKTAHAASPAQAHGGNAGGAGSGNGGSAGQGNGSGHPAAGGSGSGGSGRRP